MEVPNVGFLDPSCLVWYRIPQQWQQMILICLVPEIAKLVLRLLRSRIQNEFLTIFVRPNSKCNYYVNVITPQHRFMIHTLSERICLSISTLPLQPSLHITVLENGNPQNVIHAWRKKWSSTHQTFLINARNFNGYFQK